MILRLTDATTRREPPRSLTAAQLARLPHQLSVRGTFATVAEVCVAGFDWWGQPVGETWEYQWCDTLQLWVRY